MSYKFYTLGENGNIVVQLEEKDANRYNEYLPKRLEFLDSNREGEPDPILKDPLCTQSYMIVTTLIGKTCKKMVSNNLTPKSTRGALLVPMKQTEKTEESNN